MHDHPSLRDELARLRRNDLDRLARRAWQLEDDEQARSSVVARLTLRRLWRRHPRRSTTPTVTEQATSPERRTDLV
jgi:hypothetical protein